MEKESETKSEKKITEIEVEDEVTDSDGLEDVWRGQLKEAFKKMSPEKFEMFARGLINKMGIELDKSIGTAKLFKWWFRRFWIHNSGLF